MKPPQGSFSHRLQSAIGRNRWLLADQLLVSGFNFLTTVVVGRALGIHAFGVFSILYIILLYLNAIQLSLIVSPMMTLAPQIDEPSKRAAYLRGMATCQYCFSAVVCCVALLLPLAQKLNLIRSSIETDAMCAFGLAILCFQVQDWLRRFWYVAEDGRSVFFNDIISYMGQLAALIFLWRRSALTVESGFYVIALTSLAAFVAGARKEDVWGHLREALLSARRSWAIGKSLVVASQFQWLGSQGILLIVAAIVSVNAASGMRAAITLVGPVNILYQLLDNVVPVRAAKAFRTGGRTQLRAYLQRASLILAGLVAVPLLLIAAVARTAITLAFGRSFTPYAHLVLWQAGYAMLALIYKGLQYYHRTMGTVGILARSAMASSVVSVTSCLVLSHRYGVDGGMAALVLGQILNVGIPLWATMTGPVQEKRLTPPS
ncbi:MAG: hypothetical protein JRN15_05740 [Nitrososphaerota archaeon]|nr:hypothetical protein [Nitrososphaerota archaeon]